MDTDDQRDLLDRLSSEVCFMISDAEDEMKIREAKIIAQEEEDKHPIHTSPNFKGAAPQAPVVEEVVEEPAKVETSIPTTQSKMHSEPKKDETSSQSTSISDQDQSLQSFAQINVG
jgi:hypothetical protein